MTSFHDMLMRFIEERGVTIPAMASYCGMERSSLYRIMRGQRTPTDEDVVCRMASYLNLTPAEEEDFFLSYQVELIGYERYERRKYLDDFLHNFHTTTVENDLYSYKITHNTTKEVLATPMNSKTDVIRAFSSIITAEATLPQGGHLRLFAPPAPEFVTILQGATKSISQPLRLDHLIQMRQKENASEEVANQNFKAVLETLSLTCTNIDYHPRYFYSEVIPRLPLFMPYQVFASDSIFWVTEDLSAGLLIQHPNILPFMTRQFDASFQSCRVLYEPEKENAMLMSWKNQMSDTQEPHRLVQIIPFPPLNFDKRSARKYLRDTYPEKDGLISFLPTDISDSQKLIETNYRMLVLSELGMEQFAHTGMVPRFSSQNMTPLSKEDRIRIFRLIIDSASRMDIRFLRRDLTNVHDGLSFSVNGNHCCIEIYSEKDTSTFLVIQEPVFVDGMQDYVSSLDDTTLHTREESKQILLRILKDLKELETE